jgi:hypothetical protein
VFYSVTVTQDPLRHEIMKKERKPELIELSIKYSLVTQWTSFVAIEERKPGETVSVQPDLAGTLSFQYYYT